MTEDHGEKKVTFLPFHALNEFMTSEFRLEVVRKTLGSLESLPDHYRIGINHLTNKLVKIPGFRHSLKAPVALRVKPTCEAFVKNGVLVAAIISAWAESQPELRENVYNLLVSRGWELLPIDTDRTKIPGFLTIWPRKDTFEIIDQAFREMFPDFPASNNDISLMVVWLSGRLPLNFTTEEGTPPGLIEGPE